MRDQRAAEIFQTNQENETSRIEETSSTFLSIVIPTYNESENIIRLVSEIANKIPQDIGTEILIVDDNSPDGTGSLVNRFVQESDFDVGHNDSRPLTIKVIHRHRRDGLMCAVLDGIKTSRGKNI